MDLTKTRDAQQAPDAGAPAGTEPDAGPGTPPPPPNGRRRTRGLDRSRRRLAPQEAAGNKSDTSKAFYTAIKNGRSYAAIPQWGEVETVYKNRFGAILDAAAQGNASPDAVAKELNEAKKEADGVLAQAPS